MGSPNCGKGFLHEAAQAPLGKAALVVVERVEFALFGFAAPSGTQIGQKSLRTELTFRGIGM